MNAAPSGKQPAGHATAPGPRPRRAISAPLLVVTVLGLGAVAMFGLGFWVGAVSGLRLREFLVMQAFQAVIVLPAVAHQVWRYRAGDHLLLRWRALARERSTPPATTGERAAARPQAEEQ